MGGRGRGHLTLGHDLRPQKAWGQMPFGPGGVHPGGLPGGGGVHPGTFLEAGHSYSDDSCTHFHTYWVFALIQTSQPRPRNDTGNNW